MAKVAPGLPEALTGDGLELRADEDLSLVERWQRAAWRTEEDLRRRLLEITPHWVRYCVLSNAVQIFPIVVGLCQPQNLRGSCNVPIDQYVLYQGVLALVRFTVITPLAAFRIMNRAWPEQNFGEAMAELIQAPCMDKEPSIMRGPRLVALMSLFHLAEATILFIGWDWFSTVGTCAKRIRESALAVLVYQTLVLLCLRPSLDYICPYFYLEWQEDVDVITRVRVPPPSRMPKAAAGKSSLSEEKAKKQEDKHRQKERELMTRALGEHGAKHVEERQGEAGAATETVAATEGQRGPNPARTPKKLQRRPPQTNAAAAEAHRAWEELNVQMPPQREKRLW